MNDLMNDLPTRGYSSIGLFQPKDHYNVGGVLRAASIYRVSMVASQGHRYQRHGADTTAAWRHIPFIQGVDLKSVIPYDCVPVAIDLIDGAQSLVEYVHPDRAFYIFGPEDGTLGRDVSDWCRDVVYVPGKHCMNLAAAVNVVLYDRIAKSLMKKAEQ